MKFGATIFFTDYAITPAELGRALEGTGIRVALGTGTFSHSALAEESLAGWRRTAESLL